MSYRYASISRLVLLPVATAIFANAFSPFSPSISAATRPCTRYASSSFRLLQSRIPEGDDEDEEDQTDAPLFFDDFGDFVAGSASADGPLNPKSLTKLSERIQETRTEEIRKDARLAKNWKAGNWGVRGFILDKSDPIRESVADTTGTAAGVSTDGANIESSSAPRLGRGGNKSDPKQDVAPIHVSAVVPDQSNFDNDHEEVAALDTIAVGRSDGTVLIVKLGTEYLTTFTAVPKLRVDDKSAWGGENEDVESIKGNDDMAKEGGPTVKVETELVNTEDLKKGLLEEDAGESDGEEKQNEQYPIEDPFDELYGGGASGDLSVSPQKVPNLGTPFEVLHQFRAHEEVISALLFDDHTLYTAGGDSGEIRSWSIPEDTGEDEDEASVAVKMIPGKILSDAHSDRIVALKTLSSTQDVIHPDLLMSASKDGSFALWDIKSGDLVTRCQMLDDSAESVMITCADIDSHGAGSTVIYFGTSGGHVVGYCVSDVIGNASAGGVCPIPACRFQAHEQAVTSILAVGEGTSASSASPQARSTSIMLSGGADGVVKQWEMMARTLQESKESDLSSPSYRLEHWPRLPNQRMKRRAHLFQGHSEPVNALAQVDSTKFLSAGADGTVRVWSPSEGKEMYRMDGFTDSLTSLVLAKETLITDGMDNMVCIHDFDVDIDEADGGYELEW